MPKQYSSPPEMQIETNRPYRVLIKTNKGDIKLELNPAEAPITVNNFVTLARDGFYNGVTFHRVEPRFVIQGGDPTGTGRGGPGYQFKDEPVKRPYRAGTVAMANAGPNTNGSQFFICLEDQPTLPPNYTIFGDTISGMDVVRNIHVGDIMQSVTVD
jgi:cyclophilin family peptidyl-prolyl cis-trans isomerase